MTAYDILQTYADSINKYSGQYGVDPEMIASVIQTESSGDPNAYRAEPQISDASYGLMQLLGSTAQALGYSGDPSGLFDPDTNIMFGTKLLSQLQAKYGADDPASIYSAYNSGSPTKYQTSSQVASNVQRFLDNLSSVVSGAATTAAGAIEGNPQAASGIGVLIVAGLLLYFLAKS